MEKNYHGRNAAEYVVNTAEMKAIDRYSIENLGIPSLALMERAAQAVTEEIRKAVSGKELSEKFSLILCGMGNNGGDGLAIARMLHILGGKPVVYITGEWGKGTQEWKIQYQAVKNLKIPFCDLEQAEEILKEDRAGLIVDALYGIGLTRAITGAAAQAIDMANQSKACRVAVDIPSGISVDTGKVCKIALKADLTVTFGSLKMGCLLYPGAYYCGKTVVAQIGFPKEAYDMVSPGFFTVRACLPDREKKCAFALPSGFLPSRPAHSHKGNFGKLTVIAGTVNMSGAAWLSAVAAYRMGVGLVRIVTCEENRVILQTGLPEAILTTYDRADFSLEPIREAVRWADAAVMGPGMGTDGCAEKIVRMVLEESRIPMVLDADALRVMGGSKELRRKLKARHVATPHPGEMAALSGRPMEAIQGDPVTEAREFSHIYQTNCVLKGSRTIVAGCAGMDYINLTGNSGMATAGSGDVLSGIIGALLAQGMEPFEAAWKGVFFHGCAGDLAAREKGERALIASDLTEALVWL